MTTTTWPQFNSVRLGSVRSGSVFGFSLVFHLFIYNTRAARTAKGLRQLVGLLLGDVLIIALFVLFFSSSLFAFLSILSILSLCWIYVPDLIMQINSNGSFSVLLLLG